MNAKGLIRIALLGFLAIAVVIVARREMDDRAGEGASSQASLPADGLVAYYFHSDVRCPTCRTIEANAHEAFQSRFANELAGGKICWRIVNYELPENSRFVQEYEIAAPTVVLVRRQAGQDSQWRNLTRVWELVGDKPAFADYIAQETESLLSVK